MSKNKLDFWKFLTLLTFAWVIVNTLYLNSLYIALTNLSSKIGTTWPIKIPSIPTSSTEIKSPFTGYFLLISSPLIVNVVLGVVAVIILFLYKKL